jgi:hypothetical protein
LQEEGFESIYIKLTKDDWNSAKKSWRTFPCLNSFLAIVLGDTTAEVAEHEKALSDLKANLNWKRDKYALTVFDNAFERVKDKAANNKDKALQDWFDGKWEGTSRPNKVAIIIDKAVDLDFANGMVSTSRYIITKNRNLAQERVLLILVGVNLDRIKEKVALGPIHLIQD